MKKIKASQGKTAWLLMAVIALLVVAVFARRFIQMSGGPKPERAVVASSPGADAAKRGEEAFFKHCSVCHSHDTDDKLVGPSLKSYFQRPAPMLSNGAPAPQTDAGIRDLLQHGTRNMPPISQDLSEQETSDLLIYLHTL